jgi:hypothetical protein
MENAFRVDSLTDDELLSRTRELIARGRRIDAVLIAHIAEVEARQLHLREACTSMFVYCTERLGLSESQAYERIEIARISREVPQVLDMLADGRLTLTAAARLKPHLTRDNAEDLLTRAAHATKREVQMMVAELAPKPDVPPSIRRLPAPSIPAPSPALAPTIFRPAGVAASPPPPAAVLVPIAPARFKVTFTASAELEGKIGRARALLRHQIPSGDLAEIVDRAMTLLLAELDRKRCAGTERPRKSVADADTSPSSRHVPAPVRRAVWQRDGGRCAFVDVHGHRCSATARLEVHHVVPFGRGGDHSVENLRLMCQSHNSYQAEVDYGRTFIEARQRSDRSKPDTDGGPPRAT